MGTFVYSSQEPRVSLDEKGKAWGRHCNVLIERLLCMSETYSETQELGNVGNFRKASN